MSNLTDDALLDATHWISSLKDTLEGPDPRRVVFVVGAALSDGPDASGDSCGVWNVARIVEEIGKIDSTLTPAPPDGPAADYQRLLRLLAGTKKRRGVERLVRRAVLNACTASEQDKRGVLGGSDDARRVACERLQARNDVWRLPVGTEALAAVLERLFGRVGNEASKAPCVVTTNFDGLLEVALRRRNVPYISWGSAGDEYRRQESTQVEILHVHGRWMDDPTMHTPEALTAPRPKLGDALRDRFDGAEVYVLGYGAWEDVVFGALGQTIEGVRNVPEVMWAFYASKDDVKKALKYSDSEQKRVVDRFATALGRCGVRYYVGVDAHAHLPAVLRGASSPGHTPPGGGGSSSGGSSGLRERLDRLIRTGLERLLALTPESHQRRLQALLDAGSPFDLCTALGTVSNTMEKLVGETRHGFAIVAREELAEWALAAGAELPPPSLRSGEIHPARVRAPVFVEIMMARAQGEQPRITVRDGDAVGEDALFVEDVNLQTKRKEPDAGRDGPNWVDAFERYLWGELWPNKVFDRARLRGELQSRGDQYHSLYALIDSNASGAQWVDVAKGVPEVQFFQLGSGGDAVLPADEHRIAALIRRLLELEGGGTATDWRAGTEASGPRNKRVLELHAPGGDDTGHDGSA